ncbi:hypothetical protein KSU07_11855 [Fusobacterium animalis]|uniref:hypothetical protein n=1 Tax=Fusobacterium animalis TaxID=76859 RepID=UPI0030D48DEC
MVTLRGILNQRGYSYDSFFTNRAEDIYFETVEELCFSLGYILKNVKRIDAEIPLNSEVLGKVRPNYPITPGFTSGGYSMKMAPQYRIYFNTVDKMPLKLAERLQDDLQMRITGSLFIEACMHIGFKPGNIQCKESVFSMISKVFNESEQKSFLLGYNGE